MMGSGGLLLFLNGLKMFAFFFLMHCGWLPFPLMGSRWLLLCPNGLWMVAIIS